MKAALGVPLSQSIVMRKAVPAVGTALLVLLSWGASVGGQQPPIVLKGGRLLTVSHGVIENGILVLEDGKISAAGAVPSVKLPRNARVIDVTGMTVYPGLIDSETSLGLTEVSAENSTN